jgi:predicted patatin/cPLA2 family phospholipase
LTHPGALIIEGGGMKSAYANGVLTAFERAGHTRFDALYGTSAGGSLAAWFAAGQAEYAEATWEYAADRRVVNYRRFFTRRGPIVDHDFLLDEVYAHEHPLSVRRVQAYPAPVIVTASDADLGTCHYQDLRHGNVILWLKATGRLPFASGPVVEILGRRYLDGGITDPLPIRKALHDGHRRITLVCNSPPMTFRKDNAALARVTARRFPALRDGILRHQELKAQAIHLAENPPQGVRIDIIRPVQPTGMHRLTRDIETIHRAIRQGRADGEAHVAQAG